MDILMDDLIDLYSRLHLARQRDPRSALCQIKNHFGPLKGRMLGSLTRLELVTWFNGLPTPQVANGCLNHLRMMIKRAIEWDRYDGENRALTIKRHTIRARTRVVQFDEMPVLLRRLEREPLTLQVYFLFELLTGCRPGEARVAKWQDVKIWEDKGVLQGRWTKPHTKGGIPHMVPLSAPLCQKLLELPHVSDWIFPGAMNFRRKLPGPMSPSLVHKRWKRIREDARLLDVRPHDLRRTCASYLDHFGTSLATISKQVLQHTNFTTTTRYVQTFPEAAQTALNEHAERLLGGKKS
jgi:integrase